YLGAIVYRFNRRFNLRELPNRLLVAAIVMGPCSRASIRSPETAY
ncbi:MAG: IS1595 family transposase, partial [Methylococcus sp.]